jgi:hypothetical protein
MHMHGFCPVVGVEVEAKPFILENLRRSF